MKPLLATVLTTMILTAPAGAALGRWGFAASDEGTGRSAAYREAQASYKAEHWNEAADAFAKVAQSGGADADAALYWQAKAEQKDGRAVDALETIDRLRTSYPESRWVGDAEALELEIRPTSVEALERISERNLRQLERDSERADRELERAERERERSERREPLDEETELKVYAVQALMNADEARAVPIIEKILAGDDRFEIKDRALFVLAQGGSEQGREIIRRVATNASDPRLQLKAVEYVGVFGGGEMLGEIYDSSADALVKRKALEAMMVAGQRDKLDQVAHHEADVTLRAKAVEMLAVSGGKTELRRLYAEEADPVVRRKILETSVVTGDVEFLHQVARSATDPVVQMQAVRLLGVDGSDEASAALQELYDRAASSEVKTAVLQAMMVGDDVQGLIGILRSEQDPNLKREALRNLSLIDSDEAAQFFAEILEQ